MTEGVRKPFHLTIKRGVRPAQLPEPPVEPKMPQVGWGGEERGWDIPLPLQAPTGEKVDARVRPDNTVWVANEQIGYFDPRSGTFTPMPMTVGEQFGEAFGQIGRGALKGVEYFLKPFELFHEYVGVPFAMGVTAPGWQQTWWESKVPQEQQELLARGYRSGMLAAESPLEMLKGFFTKESEMREAYHAWEAPKYLKGAIEFVPWLILPSFGVLGGTLAALGRGGAIAARVLTPYIWTERLAGGLLKAPVRGVKALAQLAERPAKVAFKEPARYVVKAGKVVDEGVKMELPPKLEYGGLVDEIRRVYPERVRAGTEQETMVLDAWNYLLTGESFAKTQGTVIAESWLGTRQQVIQLLGLRRIEENYFNSVITNPNVTPLAKFKGASMVWHEVFGNTHKYRFTGNEGQRILALAKNYQELEAMKLTWARANNIAIKTLTNPDPEERYISRMAIAKLFGAEGENVVLDAGGRIMFERAPRPIKYGKITAEFGRKYESIDEALRAGMVYADPVLTMQYGLSQLFYRGHRLEALNLIKTLGQTESQRITAGLRESLEFWRGSRTDLVFVKAALNRVARGEKLPEVTLRKIDRILPALGVRIRELTQARLVHEATAVQIAEAELLGRELDPILAQIKGLEEQLAAEPARAFVDIVTKTGMFKGEITSLTKTHYRILTGAKWVTQRTKEGKVVRTLQGGREPTAGMLTPDGKRVRWEYALDTVATEQGYPSSDALKEAIERAVSVGRELDLLKAEAAKVRPELFAAKGAVVARVLALDKARRQAIRELMPLVDTSIKGVGLEEKAVSETFATAKVRMGKASFTEGGFVRIGELNNYIFPTIYNAEGGVIKTGAEIAKLISQKFGVDSAPKALRIASDVNRVAVSQLATLDASWWAIQGMRTLGFDAAQWATGRPSTAFLKTMINGLRAFINPNRIQHIRKQYLPIYEEFGIVPTMSHDIVVGMGILERWTRKLPVFGNKLGALVNQTYGRAQAMFNASAETSRVSIIKHLKEPWLAAGGSKIELVDYASMVSGVVDIPRLGVSRTRQLAESLSLFSPSFTRSWLMSFKKLFGGGMTAREVQKDMAGMVAAMLMGYVTLCALTDQEPRLNPAPKSLGGDGAEFLAFKKDGAIIGLPGWGYSVLRLLGSVTAAAQEKPDSLIKFSMENPTLRFVMSRSSPIVGMAKEIVTQRDFIGRRLDEPDDWAGALAKKVTPIAMQSLLLEEHAGTGRYYAFGAELFGMRTYPQSEYDKLNDMRAEYSQKEFSKGFDKLNVEEKDQLLERHPDYRAYAEEVRDKVVLERGEDIDIWEWAARKQADAEYYGILEQSARGVLAGQLDYQSYLEEKATLRKIYMGQMKTANFIRRLANPELALQYEKWAKERPPEDKALEEYWRISNDLRRSRETNLIDWNDRERRLKVYLDSLDTSTRDYVLRNKDRWILDEPLAMRKLSQVQVEGRDIIDEYYNLPEGKARTQYRQVNPTVDAWLLLMGRVSVPQTEVVIQLVIKMLQERGLPFTLVPRVAAAGFATQPERPGWEQRRPWEQEPTRRTRAVHIRRSLLRNSPIGDEFG